MSSTDPPQIFRDKVAIVTGAGTGIGRAVALALAESSCTVYVNDLDEAPLKQLPDTPLLIPHPADAADPEAMRSLVGRAIRDFGRLDYVVANAGTTRFASFLSASEEDFDAVVKLNLRGTFFLVQAAANAMAGMGGSIVLMSSNISHRAYPNLTAYSMTKAAINMMARSLALELGPLGININALAPGATLTERTAQEGEDYEGTWSALIPTGRVAQPEDIARAATFLLSEAARQISGTVLVVDGGWSGVGRHPG